MADIKNDLLISKRLITWYETNKRDLPWRHSKDPYVIWISEVILQQTRVAQGLDYFHRFVGRFPNIATLANASEDEVLRYWEGLGYYSRARNLHAAAKYMVAHYGGQFPQSYEEVRALKGIGDYTAAAIVSFAWDLPYAVVDGNVYRVLARLLAIGTPIDTSEGKKQFREAATLLLSSDHPGRHNQAIMELGSLVCMPRNPQCEVCPLADICSAYARHEMLLYPVKQGKTKSRTRYFHYFHIIYKDKTWLHKRESDDIWKGLYEFPLVETDVPMDWNGLSRQEAVVRLFEGCGKLYVSQISPIVKHVLSHQVLLAVCYVIEVEKVGDLSEYYLPVDTDNLEYYAFTSLIHKLSATLSYSQ